MKIIIFIMLLSLSLFSKEHKEIQKEVVVFIHGGAIDDYISYLLLTTMEDIDLKGVIITNADTVPDFAMRTQYKLRKYIEDDTKIGLSSARGWNTFPWSYRADAIKQSKIELLKSINDDGFNAPFPSGDKLLHSILNDALKNKEQVTLLVTCPLTALTDILKSNPKLKGTIKRLIWMGGAVNVKGNLDKNTIPKEVANDKAEWNVFWDPSASDWLFRNTSFEIVLFPLDVTDQAKITDKLKRELALNAPKYKYSNVVHQSYSVIDDEPFYEMWNTVTTVYITHPEYFSNPKTIKLKVISDGFEQGAIVKSVDGREVDVILDIIDKDSFYNYVIKEFKRD